MTSRLRQTASALWARHVADPWREAEGLAAAHRAARGTRPDRQAIVVLLVAPICLSGLFYFGMSDHAGGFAELLAALGLDGLADDLRGLLSGERARLTSLLYWVSSCVLWYLVIPALVVRFVLRQRLSDYGMSVRGALHHAHVYAALYLLVLPAVVAVSFAPAFQEQYPFYRGYGALPPGFLLWELGYAAQFLALEFFFRGFLLHGLVPRLGGYAIFVMIGPYCLIHFGKPFPETIGAIAAGVILGLLSLRARSIWLGVAIHVSVAWTMDALALWHAGLL
jgi:membrane protease YdiL (CAAX protease family)